MTCDLVAEGAGRLAKWGTHRDVALFRMLFAGLAAGTQGAPPRRTGVKIEGGFVKRDEPDTRRLR